MFSRVFQIIFSLLSLICTIMAGPHVLAQETYENPYSFGPRIKYFSQQEGYQRVGTSLFFITPDGLTELTRLGSSEYRDLDSYLLSRGKEIISVAPGRYSQNNLTLFLVSGDRNVVESLEESISGNIMPGDKYLPTEKELMAIPLSTTLKSMEFTPLALTKTLYMKRINKEKVLALILPNHRLRIFLPVN